MLTRRWLLPKPIDPVAVQLLAKDATLARFAAELLIRRGVTTAVEAKSFLDPRLQSLRDPFLLPNMEAAVTRIFQAVDRGERVVLYGDYDVDGVTSLALLRRVLRAFGVDAPCFLPLRADEGYGLSAGGVARCLLEHQPQLIIAVDCGTSSVLEVAGLQAEGVDVVIIDHHECSEELPPCVALVNPKLGKAFHYFCTVGLVFKTAHALIKRRPEVDFDLKSHLDLVALGTVADLVPLLEENRTLVKRGLRQLEKTRWVGLKALIEVSGLRPPFTPPNVGFGLGPRLNAAGRLGTAADALELLLTEDVDRANCIATNLDALNRERRAVEEEVLREAEIQLEEWFDPERDSAIVVGARGWHTGVIGIVASRLQKQHHRPTLVIGFDAAGMGKGSGRSITGFSLVAALADCGQFLEKHGGHEMAAGLTIEEKQFDAFRKAFLAYAREKISGEQLQPRLHLDGELTLGEIDYELLDHHEALQPYGMGQPQPVFVARGVTLAGEPRVMKAKHLSLMLRQHGDEYRAVWFGAAQDDLPERPWDIAFQIERNEWQGTITPQIHVRAVRRSE